MSKSGAANFEITSQISIEGSGTGSAMIVGLRSGSSVPALGGFAYVRSGGLTISRASISGFRATQGGAVYVEDGAMFISTNSTYSSNQAAADGGALYCKVVTSGTCTLHQVTLNQNTAAHFGGGVYLQGEGNFTNTTISGNTAAQGGGIYHGVITDDRLCPSACPVLSYLTDDLTLTHNTIAFNHASAGAGGIYNPHSSETGDSPKVILKNTIISNDLPSDCGGAYLESAGHNLIQNPGGVCSVSASAGADLATDKVGQDPNLLPLANNGGDTQTHAFRSNVNDSGISVQPALGSGDTHYCTTTGVDQRNVPRGAICDMGAFSNTSPQNLGVSVVEVFSSGAASRTFNINVFNSGSFLSADAGMLVANNSLLMPTKVILDVILSSPGRTVSFDAGSLRNGTGTYVSALCDNLTGAAHAIDPSHFRCTLRNFAVGDRISLIANVSNETFAGGVTTLSATVNAEDTVRNPDPEPANNSHSVSRYVTGPTDFAYSLYSSTLSVSQGTTSACFFVTVDRPGGFDGSETITAAPPAGLSLGFNLASDTACERATVTRSGAPVVDVGLITIPSGQNWSRAILGIPANIPLGTYPININFSGGGVTHSLPLSLVVTAAPVPPVCPGDSRCPPPVQGFTLSATPSPVAVVQGASGTVSVAITRTGGLTTPVGLALTGLPSGVTWAWNTTTGDTRILTLTVPVSTPVASSTITINGLADFSNSITFILNVTAPIAGGPGPGPSSGLGGGPGTGAAGTGSAGGGCNLSEANAPGFAYSLLSLLGLIALRFRVRPKN